MIYFPKTLLCRDEDIEAKYVANALLLADGRDPVHDVSTLQHFVLWETQAGTETQYHPLEREAGGWHHPVKFFEPWPDTFLHKDASRSPMILKAIDPQQTCMAEGPLTWHLRSDLKFLQHLLLVQRLGPKPAALLDFLRNCAC